MASAATAYRGPVVGLDVTGSAVRLVQLSHSPEGPRITSFAQTPLPEGVVDSGAVLRPDVLSEAVTRTFKIAKIQPKKSFIVTALSPASVFIRQISVPRMTDEELQSAIKWEAERYLPFDPNEAEVSFHKPLNPLFGDESSESEMAVVLVAAKRHVIDSNLDSLETSGVKPKILEVSLFALPWICKYLPPEDGEERENLERKLQYQGLNEIGAAYLDISVDQTGLLILCGEDFRLSRSLPVGSAKLIRDPGDGRALELEPSAFDTLASELRRNLDYYSKVLKGLTSRVYLSGDGATLPGLQDALERECEAVVEIVKPLRGLSVDRAKVDKDDMEKNGPALAVAVGLALRGMNHLG